MTKHKHAELIKAWADGAKIQAECPDGRWIDDSSPVWLPHMKYRIKPDIPKLLCDTYPIEVERNTMYSRDEYATLVQLEIGNHHLEVKVQSTSKEWVEIIQRSFSEVQDDEKFDHESLWEKINGN